MLSIVVRDREKSSLLIERESDCVPSLRHNYKEHDGVIHVSLWWLQVFIKKSEEETYISYIVYAFIMQGSL